VRASRAAHDQVEAIRALGQTGALGELPEGLREAAELRLRYPSLSLTELARKARPPASKASIYRRLRRLTELASH
jgi:DNA-binding protein WhiA